MKHILLPEESGSMRYYRANLHCHTTNSDGQKTPAQIKADYGAHGYSVVAFTDHDIFLPHNDLTDDNFLALNGYEIEIKKDAPNFGCAKTTHLCFVALEPDNDVPVCLHRSDYAWGNAAALSGTMHWDPEMPDYIREYTPECINDMIARARAAGFYVTYNHPEWSLEGYAEYSQLKGMNAMEIRNYGCVALTAVDTDNSLIYTEMLNLGNKISALATDDNHNDYPDDHPNCDSYGGCVYIAADRLEYRSITKALEEGRFFASSGDYKNDGPRILGLSYDDEAGTVSVKTSEAASIYFLTDMRYFEAKNAADGETIDSAVFKLSPFVKWFRLVVTDRKSFKAFSNAYFAEDLK